MAPPPVGRRLANRGKGRQQVHAKIGPMPDVQTEDRFSQALLHLAPEEIYTVQRALAALSEDPFRGRMLAGADNIYLLRASDQLRIIYRVERRPKGESSASVIVAEDLISREALRRYLPGGADEAF